MSFLLMAKMIQNCQIQSKSSNKSQKESNSLFILKPFLCHLEIEIKLPESEDLTKSFLQKNNIAHKQNTFLF